MTATADSATPGPDPGAAPKPTRPRKPTVSLPGRDVQTAAVVDAPSVADDLRSQPMLPSTTTGSPIAPLTSPARTTTAAAPAAQRTAPPPPPKRQAPPRIQFSTKLPPALITDVKDFSEHHKAEIQIVVELALREYMTSRGWEMTS